jgi:hypothetical protein
MKISVCGLNFDGFLSEFRQISGFFMRETQKLKILIEISLIHEELKKLMQTLVQHLMEFNQRHKIKSIQ